MKASWKTGLGFGLTSGVITTLGLMVGLHSGTHSRAIVIGGILTIAIADALGIHVSEESKNNGPTIKVWESTLATFVTKFVIAMTFVIPVMIRPLDQAIIISVIWGLLLLGGLSYFVARAQAIPPWKVIGEHLLIAICVVAIAHAVGDWVQGLEEVG
jgi:VIT1/CCC1 family predicted Fe2+/Mn2+ transporter